MVICRRRTWLALVLILIGLGMAPLASAAACTDDAVGLGDDADNDGLFCAVPFAVIERHESVTSITHDISPVPPDRTPELFSLAPKTSPPLKTLVR